MELSKLVVLDSDGNIDIRSSVAKFEIAITLAAEARKNDLTVIGNTVTAIFTEFRGTRITLPALTSMTLSKLNVSPVSFNEMADRVKGYVHQNTEAGNGITESGVPALFGMSKGRGGGFYVLKDQVKPA